SSSVAPASRRSNSASIKSRCDATGCPRQPVAWRLPVLAFRIVVAGAKGAEGIEEVSAAEVLVTEMPAQPGDNGRHARPCSADVVHAFHDGEKDRHVGVVVVLFHVGCGEGIVSTGNVEG